MVEEGRGVKSVTQNEFGIVRIAHTHNTRFFFVFFFEYFSFLHFALF